jgi:integration host factor subunit alpha
MPTNHPPSSFRREELAEAVYRACPMARREARSLVDEVLEEITVALMQDGVVMLSGFGKFEVRRKAARIGRNPKTGEEHEITPRRSVVFRPSSLLRSKVSGGQGDSEASVGRDGARRKRRTEERHATLAVAERNLVA